MHNNYITSTPPLPHNKWLENLLVFLKERYIHTYIHTHTHTSTHQPIHKMIRKNSIPFKLNSITHFFFSFSIRELLFPTFLLVFIFCCRCSFSIWFICSVFDFPILLNMNTQTDKYIQLHKIKTSRQHSFNDMPNGQFPWHFVWNRTLITAFWIVE